MKSKKELVLTGILSTSFAFAFTVITLKTTFRGWALLQHLL